MPITSFTNVHEFRSALLVHPIPDSIHQFHPCTIFPRTIGGLPLPPVAIESFYFLAGTFPLPFSLPFSVWEANPKLIFPQSSPLHPKFLVNGILLLLALYLQQFSRHFDQLITNVLKGNYFPIRPSPKGRPLQECLSWQQHTYYSKVCMLLSWS